MNPVWVSQLQWFDWAQRSNERHHIHASDHQAGVDRLKAGHRKGKKYAGFDVHTVI